MNSSEYWAKREAEALKHYITDEKEYDKQLKRIYSNMLDACQTEINAFYGKYAAKEGITLAEAKKRVSEMDIKAYERKAAKYVKDKDFSPKANEEMRLYNAAMKINRLEMLKANIGKELIAGHDELEKFMGEILQGRTEDELKRQAGILGKTVRNNAQKAHAIVNASFHNATFSDRIWMYQDLMKADIAKLLESGLIQGKNPRALARDLKKTFNTSTFNAERLMRTELARVQTEAQKQSFIRNGFEEYEFIVNAGCCPICQGLSGKHFKVVKMMPGENAPPMHPHCRCSTAAYSDREDYEEWLDYLDKGGTTEEYNKMKAQKVNNLSTPKTKQSDIIQLGAITGAYNSKNDPDGSKRDQHAKTYYASMRNSDKEDIVSTISKNANVDAESVSKMYDHLFINKYDLEKGHTTFDEDYDISQSIQRLREGKNIQEHDRLLVMHEAIEYDLMNNKGLPYAEAHDIANKKYNYKAALDKWLDENEG
jgi:SPP1 gp7 family putative phage head morphogenesis protein